MAESKPSEKAYPLHIKQENYEGLNWGNLDHDTMAEMSKYPHSNSFFTNKFQSKNPLLLNDFNNILMGNPDFHPESVPFNPNTNLNFIGDLNENSLKTNTNLLMPDKSNDLQKPMGFSLNDKMQSNMSDMFAGSYGINKFLAKPYQTDFQPVPQAKNPNPFASIPFYFPFLGTYRRPLPPELIEEEPIYVNPRQYERIIKRRIQKASRGLKSDPIALDKNKSPYKHLSRHLHAKRRIRGKGGRFLSKEEADKERQMQQTKSQDGDHGSPSTNKDHLASTSKSSNGDYSQEESEPQVNLKSNFHEKAPKHNENKEMTAKANKMSNALDTKDMKI